MRRLPWLLTALLFIAAEAGADTRPVMTFSDTVWPEGDGETEAYFTVSLSAPFWDDIPLGFRLYLPPGSDSWWWAQIRIDCPGCVLPAGQTSARVRVLIFGNESYQSATREWQAALFAGSLYDGTLVNLRLTEDDPIPVVTLADAFVTEGDSDVTWLPVTLTSSSPNTGRVAWRTIAETADETTDYTPGSFHFPDFQQPIQFRNTSSLTIGFGIQGDTQVEPDETFVLELFDPFDLTVEPARMRVTILNDDSGEPPISLDPAEIALYCAESADIEVTATAAYPHSTVHLQTTSDAISVPSEIEVPGTFSVIAMSPGSAEVRCGGDETLCGSVRVEVTAPTLSEVSPRRVPVSGGTAVTLRGIGFSYGCSVRFDGAPVVNRTIVDLGTIVAIAPPHAAGIVDVTITCASVTLALPKALEYVASTRRRSIRH